MQKNRGRQLIGYLVLSVFFGFLSYQAVLWFRHSLPWRTYVVQSGSMEPSIMTGDVIVIQKRDNYHKNEVITFTDANKRTVTHRVLTVTNENQPVYYTKGDANQTADTTPIPHDAVKGVVVQVIPKFGYVVQFVRSPWGVILCIIIPSTILLYDELRNIFNSLKRRRS